MKDEIFDQNDIIDINWSFLLENFSFFNELFSTYYSFTEQQLLNYQNIISIGKPAFRIDSGSHIVNSRFGLIFNKNIIWTNLVQSIVYKNSILINSGNGNDKYAYNIEFNKLPLDLSEELNTISNLMSNHENNFSKFSINFETMSLIDIIIFIRNIDIDFCISNIKNYYFIINLIKDRIPYFTVDIFYDIILSIKNCNYLPVNK